MNVFQFLIICKRTNNVNNATHYVKLGKKRRENSKRNYYIISPRVIIKAIIIKRIEENLQVKKPTSKQTRLFEAKMFPRNGTTGQIEQFSHGKSLAGKEVQ